MEPHFFELECHQLELAQTELALAGAQKELADLQALPASNEKQLNSDRLVKRIRGFLADQKRISSEIDVIKYRLKVS